MKTEVKSFEDIEALLQKSISAWVKIIGFIRTSYVMDEFWNGKDELKFRHSGRTLVTFYVKDSKFTALIILGKKEREKFDLIQSDFSQYIRDIYHNTKTYHDGKWLFIDVDDISQANDIIELIKIKRKENRKEKLDNAILGKCGNRCDQCLLYIKNNETEKGRLEFQTGDWKCYHTGDANKGNDYSDYICNGCHEDCEVFQCVLSKGHTDCSNCNYHACEIDNNNFTNPGRCNLGLSAEDIDKFVFPYCGKERFEKMEKM